MTVSLVLLALHLNLLLAYAADSEFRRIGFGVFVLNAGRLDLAGGSCYLDYILTVRRDTIVYNTYQEAVTANGTNSIDRVCHVEKGNDWQIWDGNSSDILVVNLDSFGEIRPLENGQFRIMGTHFFRTQLAKWPFETQQLEILIELKDQMQSENFDVVLCHIFEYSGLSSSIRFPGEQFLQLTMGHQLFERCWPAFSAPNAHCLKQSYISSDCSCTAPPHVYHSESDHFSCRCQGGQRISSRYRGEINFNRPENTAFIKVYLPPLFLVLVTILTYVLPVNELSTRLSICGTTLLAAVFFHVSLLDKLPPTSTLTEADKIMINVYAVNLLAWLISMVMMLLDHSKYIKKSTVHSIYSFTRVFLPILSISSFVLSIYSDTKHWELWLAIILGGMAISFFFLLIQMIVDRCLDPESDFKKCLPRRRRQERTRIRLRPSRTPAATVEVELKEASTVKTTGTDAQYQTFTNAQET